MLLETAKQARAPSAWQIIQREAVCHLSPWLIILEEGIVGNVGCRNDFPFAKGCFGASRGAPLLSETTKQPSRFHRKMQFKYLRKTERHVVAFGIKFFVRFFLKCERARKLREESLSSEVTSLLFVFFHRHQKANTDVSDFHKVEGCSAPCPALWELSEFFFYNLACCP